MLALISLEYRSMKGFFNKLRCDSRYRIYRDNRAGINLIRLELYFNNRIAKPLLYKRARKAIRKLSKLGVRSAIIPEAFEFNRIIKDMGIRIVDSKPLFIKMLPKLTRHCAGELGIDLKKAVAVIHGEKSSVDIVKLAMSLSTDIRYLSVISRNSYDICKEISEKSGISVLTVEAPRELYDGRVDLYLKPKDEGAILEIDGHSLLLSDIEFELPEKFRSSVPCSVVAPFLSVLSENGMILTEEILIKQVLLRRTVT